MPPQDPNAGWNYLNGPQGAGAPSGWTAPSTNPNPAPKDAYSAGVDTTNSQQDWGPWIAAFGGGAATDPWAGASPGQRPIANDPVPAAPASPFAPAPETGGGSNDLSLPGYAESYFSQNQGGFTAPTQTQGWAASQLPWLGQSGPAEQYWNGVSGQFNANPNASNRADQAYQDFLNRRPNIAEQPNLGAYYQDAEKRATDTLNQEAAARGNYGSSVALGEVGKAVGGLEADRAKNEANYQLARDAAINQQGQTLGALGSGADVSSRGGLDLIRNWLATGGNMASDAQGAGIARSAVGGQLANASDTQGLSRLLGGASAATMAENSKEGRIGQLLSSALGPYGMLSGMAGDTYGTMLGNDQDMFGAQIGAPIYAAREGANAQSQVDARNTELAKLIMGYLQKNPGGGASPAGAG